MAKNLFREELSEHEIQNQIRQALSYTCVVFRANVGKFKVGKNKNGTDRWMTTGLEPGFPDLFGFRKSDGKAFFIEVKRMKGKVSIKQKNFAEHYLCSFPVLYGVARSVEEALSVVEK